MKVLTYMGCRIGEADAAKKAQGFNWFVDLSKLGARQPSECPHFDQLPAAKAYVREQMLDEKPFNDDDGGASA
jgi:hypothetical protein